MRAGHALWKHGKFCLKSNGVLEISPPKLWHSENVWIVCLFWTFKTHRTDFALERLGQAYRYRSAAIPAASTNFKIILPLKMTSPSLRWRRNRSCFVNVTAAVAEWLRRLTRNQIPFGSAGSNPAGCEYVLQCRSVFLSLSRCVQMANTS